MSTLQFSPLSGAQNEDPLCYVLEIGDCRIMLDCGWDERFIEAKLDAIKRIAPEIDAVILSHASINHLGALPFLIGRRLLRPDVEIISTQAVYAMGQLYCYDAHESRRQEGQFDLFSLDDVDTAFDRVVQLKFSQSRVLQGEKCAGITVTPYVAGHTVGGSIWKITKDDGEEVIYAVDFNGRRERHLNACPLDSGDPKAYDQFKRASLLITDSLTAMRTLERRVTRDQKLVGTIMETLRRGGNVLLPTDTAGRVLEISKVLDDHWSKNKLGGYGLVLLNNVAYNAIEFAKSHVEWMSGAMIGHFDKHRENPYQLKYLVTCNSIEQLEHLPYPLCVLATQSSLESGYARTLFMKWCAKPQNTVLFTDRSFTESVARRVMSNKPPCKIPIVMRWQVELTGAELEAHRASQRAARAADDEMHDVEQIVEEEEEAEDMDIDQGLQRHIRRRKIYRRREVQNQHLQFPHENRDPSAWDEFGEVMRPEDFVAVPDVVADMVAAVVQQPAEEEEEEKKKEEDTPESVPTKEVIEERLVDVNCNVEYIDLEGRSDKTSLHNILLKIAPRKLVIVHGGVAATQSLVSFCNEHNSVIERVIAPTPGELVDVTSDISLYRLKLKDAFFENICMVPVGDSAVAHVSAVLRPDVDVVDDTDTRAVPLVAHSFVSRSDPRAARLPRDEVAPGRSCILVGDVKLKDFRTAVIKAGLEAEFVRGTLVINKNITLKKQDNSVHMEGVVCEEYYTVRELLYNEVHVF